MPKDPVHAAMTPKTADGITPPTPRKTGKKKKRSGKPAPFVRVTTWMGAQTGEHDRHVSEELLPHLWTCTHLSDSHGFGSGQGRRLGGFEGDGAEVAKAPVPTVRVVPRFDRVENGLEHVGP